MPVCPFCKGAVAADVLRFGGNCPHCMLEIPGEEAPTDPGLQARLKKEQEDKAKQAEQKKRTRRFGVLASVVALLLVGGAGYAWKTYQDSLEYDVDDFYEFPLEDLAVAAPPPEATAPVGGPDERPRNGTGPRRPTGGGETLATTSNTPPDDGGPRSATGTRSTDDIRPASMYADGGAGGGLGGGAIKISQPDLVLTDDQAIFDMAKQVISARSPQLTSCYNQRLKQVETLKGAWEVSLVITKDGSTKNVKAVGVNGADADLESCIVRAVSSWQFQKIAKDIPVKKVYRFGASSWG